ncbi:hypothetical protein IWW36_003328 [Coemansia brasiliensis]|uniref:Fork-head domain-containing protein n=1 Tax=Coemansia brasiliensis TaxID=2650707 RepID=A0A9W8LYN2_9FUNG|nr:hypothetical protein IWW36_003328 [Coemansia brasiliensis]
MLASSSAQAGQQQLNPAAFLQYDPQLQQSTAAAGQAPPHRRSFDMSALQLPGSPVHITQQQSHQLQQTAPMFPTAQMSMNDSGVGFAAGPYGPAAKPPSRHSMQQAQSNRSSICSVSDNAGISSPLQEHASLGNMGASDIALLLSGALQVKPNTSGKPPYPYATLITYAILQHPRKQMTLSEIYAWLMHYYPYFKTAGSGWKNSIRHNLSLNKMFLRIPRPINEPGKGAYWTVDLAILDEVLNAKPKPTIHHYSPSGTMRNDSMVHPPPISSTGTVPSLTLTAPNAGPSVNPHALMAGLSSSISDKGTLVEAADGGMPARRASLQAMPMHRYQPYTMPPQPGMHSVQQGSAAQPLPPSLCNPGDLQLADAHARNIFNPQPAFPVPFSGSASMAAGFAIPSSGLGGAPSGSTMPAHPSANPPAFPGASAAVDPQGSFGSSLAAHVPLASGSFGRMAAPLSLRTNLQVRPTPSLPEHLLGSQNPELARKESPSPSVSIQGSDMAISPVAAVSAGETKQSDAPSIGDLSAYFAFVDSQDSTAQSASKPT